MKEATLHKKVLEAALFMSSRPLKMTELARISGLGSAGHLKSLLGELRQEYSERGLLVVESPEGWQMQVQPEILPNVAHLTPYADLSEGCKRALALIVYKEPLAQSELIRIQGNKAYSYIRRLERAGLVRAEKAGRTKMLSLTQEFENYFGENREQVKERLAAELKV
ncbi:MAG: SMC-Scp complex subunit ScpB [Candidatus Aenigmatarchaeota archaeon]